MKRKKAPDTEMRQVLARLGGGKSTGTPPCFERPDWAKAGDLCVCAKWSKCPFPSLKGIRCVQAPLPVIRNPSKVPESLSKLITRMSGPSPFQKQVLQALAAAEKARTIDGAINTLKRHAQKLFAKYVLPVQTAQAQADHLDLWEKKPKLSKEMREIAALPLDEFVAKKAEELKAPSGRPEKAIRRIGQGDPFDVGKDAIDAAQKQLKAWQEAAPARAKRWMQLERARVRLEWPYRPGSIVARYASQTWMVVYLWELGLLLEEALADETQLPPWWRELALVEADQFSSTIGHRYKTPAAAVKGLLRKRDALLAGTKTKRPNVPAADFLGYQARSLKERIERALKQGEWAIGKLAGEFDLGKTPKEDALATCRAEISEQKIKKGPASEYVLGVLMRQIEASRELQKIARNLVTKHPEGLPGMIGPRHVVIAPGLEATDDETGATFRASRVASLRLPYVPGIVDRHSSSPRDVYVAVQWVPKSSGAKRVWYFNRQWQIVKRIPKGEPKGRAKAFEEAVLRWVRDPMFQAWGAGIYFYLAALRWVALKTPRGGAFLEVGRSKPLPFDPERDVRTVWTGDGSPPGTERMRIAAVFPSAGPRFYVATRHDPEGTRPGGTVWVQFLDKPPPAWLRKALVEIWQADDLTGSKPSTWKIDPTGARVKLPAEICTSVLGRAEAQFAVVAARANPAGAGGDPRWYSTKNWIVERVSKRGKGAYAKAGYRIKAVKPGVQILLGCPKGLLDVKPRCRPRKADVRKAMRKGRRVPETGWEAVAIRRQKGSASAKKAQARRRKNPAGNPIRAHLERWLKEGLAPMNVHANRGKPGTWRIWTSFWNTMPVQEDSEPLPDVPEGVSISGFSRFPNQIFEVRASEEGIVSMMADAARFMGAGYIERHRPVGTNALAVVLFHAPRPGTRSNPQGKLQRVCKWCGIDLDTGKPAVADGRQVTHGICHPCKDQVLKDWGLRENPELFPAAAAAKTLLAPLDSLSFQETLRGPKEYRQLLELLAPVYPALLELPDADRRRRQIASRLFMLARKEQGGANKRLRLMARAGHFSDFLDELHVSLGGDAKWERFRMNPGTQSTIYDYPAGEEWSELHDEVMARPEVYNLLAPMDSEDYAEGMKHFRQVLKKEPAHAVQELLQAFFALHRYLVRFADADRRRRHLATMVLQALLVTKQEDIPQHWRTIWAHAQANRFAELLDELVSSSVMSDPGVWERFRTNPLAQQQELLVLSNPSRKKSSKALTKIYRRFHGNAPRRRTRHVAPPGTPAELVAIGDLEGVTYKVFDDRSEKRGLPWRHAFAVNEKTGKRTRAPRPVLATDASGKHLYIVGGNFRVTERGIVG